MYNKIKTDAEIAAMRESGRMLATVLETLKKNIAAGMTTKDLSSMASDELKHLGGEPAFLGYQGYNDILCVSINEEVVHGIPSPKRVLIEGDIVGLDFGVNYKGMITDSAISVIVGKPRHAADQRLVRGTKRALDAGIAAVRDGVHVGDIGAAIQDVLDRERLGIVRDLVGHGVGHKLHEDPNIPNYGSKQSGPILKSGMTIAIEPMATLGDYHVYIDEDGWTVKTSDGTRSAHFEHTVLVTDKSSEILTAI